MTVEPPADAPPGDAAADADATTAEDAAQDAAMFRELSRAHVNAINELTDVARSLNDPQQITRVIAAMRAILVQMRHQRRITLVQMMATIVYLPTLYASVSPDLSETARAWAGAASMWSLLAVIVCALLVRRGHRALESRINELAPPGGALAVPPAPPWHTTVLGQQFALHQIRRRVRQAVWWTGAACGATLAASVTDVMPEAGHAWRLVPHAGAAFLMGAAVTAIAGLVGSIRKLFPDPPKPASVSPQPEADPDAAADPVPGHP